MRAAPGADVTQPTAVAVGTLSKPAAPRLQDFAAIVSAGSGRG
jgi:hypothetical protein